MLKILIVDDSATARMFLRKCAQMVVNNEAEFIEAENGEESLKLLGSSKVDLIISDVNMPVMSGFTFLRNLMDNPEYARIPVIFTTSLANDARTRNLIELGARAVIRKPVSPALLGKAVRSILEKPGPGSSDSWGGIQE